MSIIADVFGAAATVVTGGVGGAILRLLPEAIKLFASAGDRKHEIQMRRIDLEIARTGGEQKLREIDQAGAIQVSLGQLEMHKSAIQAQAVKTGNKLADALNVLVRPLTTYYFLGLYGLNKLAVCIAALLGGATLVDVLPIMWTADDQAMLSGTLSFWFFGRVMDKKGQ